MKQEHLWPDKPYRGWIEAERQTQLKGAGMGDYGRFEYITVSINDRIATVTLNRPESLNSINHEMHEELEEAFPELGRDPGVACIVVTGAGRGFCAGGDVKMMAEDTAGRANPLNAEAPARLMTAMLRAPQPIIAAVNGAAVGLGSTIALFCDVVIASDRAKFGDLHVKAGLVAGDGGAIIWPMLVGLNKAKELLMTADIIDAEEAFRIGAVQRLVPHERLMEETMGLARQLADGPQLAIRWTKQALNKQLWEKTVQLGEYGGALEQMSFGHRDHDEAARAFVEKRDPKFPATIN